jgi:predicted outer membrane repeat protein
MKNITIFKQAQLLILGLLTCIVSFSQTYVSGTIDGETWDMEGSPYIMMDNLLIADLVIEPGVTVQADSGFVIEVAGIITAIGTEQDSIIFTTTNSIAGWQGLLFNVTTFDSKLKYCIIEHSMNSGIRVINSTPVFENCTLSENSASEGGAMYFFNDTEIGSEFTLSDCSFIANTSTGNGGAIYVSLTEGHFILDHSRFIGNLSNPTQATGNFSGGAIFLVTGDATILNSFFLANRSDSRCVNTFDCNVTARGGAIYIGSSGNIVIENSIFLENQTHAENDGNCFFGGSSQSYGGAVYVDEGTVTLSNDIFAYNLNTRTNCGPSTGGGGVFVNGGMVNLINSSIAYNYDATGIQCPAGTLDVLNSIIFFNNQEFEQIGGSCTVTYSAVQDGFIGEGNISSNPVFYLYDSTFQISSVSPCIDAGNPNTPYNDVCFPPSLGESRNDMGAYGGPLACNWLNISSDMTDILSYSFPEQTGPATIDPVSHTVFIEVEYGTSLTDLVATFTLSDGATATVGGVNQQSGVTANDFTSPVTYVVTAEDGVTAQDWVITVDTLTGIFEFWDPIMSIYPNPFTNKATIKFPNPSHSTYNLFIFNTSGNEVFEMQNIRSDQIEFERGNLPGGIYLFELKGENIYSGKMVIQ